MAFRFSTPTGSESVAVARAAREHGEQERKNNVFRRRGFATRALAYCYLWPSASPPSRLDLAVRGIK